MLLCCKEIADESWKNWTACRNCNYFSVVCSLLLSPYLHLDWTTPWKHKRLLPNVLLPIYNQQATNISGFHDFDWLLVTIHVGERFFIRNIIKLMFTFQLYAWHTETMWPDRASIDVSKRFYLIEEELFEINLKTDYAYLNERLYGN